MFFVKIIGNMAAIDKDLFQEIFLEIFGATMLVGLKL